MLNLAKDELEPRIAATVHHDRCALETTVVEAVLCAPCDVVDTVAESVQPADFQCPDAAHVAAAGLAGVCVDDPVRRWEQIAADSGVGLVDLQRVLPSNPSQLLPPLIATRMLSDLAWRERPALVLAELHHRVAAGEIGAAEAAERLRTLSDSLLEVDEVAA